MAFMREWLYQRNKQPTMDEEFFGASSFGKVKLGTDYIFWKKEFRWYFLELSNVQRAFRRVEAVNTKMCCGNVNFDIQKLVFVLKDTTEIELVIGDTSPQDAKKLYEMLQKRQPDIIYGKKCSKMPILSRKLAGKELY